MPGALPPLRNCMYLSVTRPRFRLPQAVLRLLVLALLCAAGCSKGAASVKWDLGVEGETMYYFLVQLEAASSGDTEAYAAAGEKLLDLDPSEASFLEMAEFSVRLGRLEEARTTARKGLALFPASLPLALVISDTYIQQERIDEAADILLLFRRAHPGNEDAMQELARVYLVGERYAEFDALLKSVPPAKMTPYLHYVKARSLLNRLQFAEGERELRLVVKQAPDMTDAWVNLGIALQLQEKYSASFPMFRKALEQDPENLGTWLRLIDAQLRGNRVDLAMRTVNEAPPSATLQMEAAMLFVERKQYAMARKIFQQVRDTPGAPEDVHIYLAALAMENLNNPSEALRELAMIPPHSPLAERALRWRLQILKDQGRIHECVPIAREYAASNPQALEFQVIYAQALTWAGDTQTAIALLRDARAKWPENVDVALYLASSLDAKADKDEALRLMEFVISRQPRNALALNFVGYMLADDNRDLERAYELLTRAVAEAPEDPHIADSLAWVLYRLGNYDKAWEAIRKSISLGGDHPVIWEHYGDIAAKLGNRAEARKGYTHALKAMPDDPDAIQRKLREIP